MQNIKMSDNNKSILIKFKPLEPYFFGGEKTLGGGDEQSYFAESRNLPQQTGILGALRYQLLQVNNALSGQSDFNKADAIIGPSSFVYNAPKAQSFGMIKGISPLFLMNSEDEIFIPIAREFVQEETEEGSFYHWLDLDNATIGRKNQASNTMDRIPLLKRKKVKNIVKNKASNDQETWREITDEKAYSTKNYFLSAWVSSKGEIVQEDEIFGSKTQVGIIKYGDDDGFYKQTFKYLKNGWSFACWLDYEPNDSFQFLPEKWNMEMGGERSKFHVSCLSDFSASDLQSHFSNSQAFLPSEHFEKVVLVSDSYISMDIYKDAVFSNISSVGFKNLQSTSKVKNYAALDRATTTVNDNTLTKSIKLNLIQKGSVFYCKEGKAKDVQQKLAHSNFQAIGYNHSLIIPKQS
jgi:CRISPR type III-B/RAMP module-associated protein Cmr3